MSHPSRPRQWTPVPESSDPLYTFSSEFRLRQFGSVVRTLSCDDTESTDGSKLCV